MGFSLLKTSTFGEDFLNSLHHRIDRPSRRDDHLDHPLRWGNAGHASCWSYWKSRWMVVRMWWIHSEWCEWGKLSTNMQLSRYAIVIYYNHRMWWIIAVCLKFWNRATLSNFLLGFSGCLWRLQHIATMYTSFWLGDRGKHHGHVMLFSPCFWGKWQPFHRGAPSHYGGTMPRVGQLTPLKMCLGWPGSCSSDVPVAQLEKTKKPDDQLKIVTDVIKCLQSSTSW